MAGDDEAGPAVIRRNSRGSSHEDWNSWPGQEYDDIETSLATCQYVQQLTHADPADVAGILALPEDCDENVWRYEHFRQICSELNGLVAALIPVCTPEKFPEMTAGPEWKFRFADPSGEPREVSAISYIMHTLDQAATLVTSEKFFPSRIQVKDASLQKLNSTARRVYRIFAHAYYHHREIFDEFEQKTSLCRRMDHYVRKYEMMSEDQLIVPIAEAATSMLTEASDA